MFWAQGYSHNLDNRTAKLLTNGQKRRESARQLCLMQQQLRQLNPMELRSVNSTINLPFQFVLPESLPSTFLFAGENMSMFSVEYWLDVKVLGLTATQFGVPNSAILQQRFEQVVIRAREPPVKPGIEQVAVGQLKGALGKKKGECKVTGYMACDVSMQNQPAQLLVNIDNRKAEKAVIMVRLLLHREIKATGRSITGQDLMFEDKQVVGSSE